MYRVFHELNWKERKRAGGRKKERKREREGMMQRDGHASGEHLFLILTRVGFGFLEQFCILDCGWSVPTFISSFQIKNRDQLNSIN